MDEITRIKQTYDSRKLDHRVIRAQKNIYYAYFTQMERELIYLQILKKHHKDLSQIKLMEIGAGTGGNLLFFYRIGIPWKNIWANELLEERAAVIRKDFPAVHLHVGNALDLPFENFFDVTFQSTVFTSILDTQFKKNLAVKMLDMVNPGGMVLWYDFVYDNPKNKEVKGIPRREIKELFSDAGKIKFYSVTLAPPIGRLVGKWYNVINTLFPFLKTHVIAEIHK
ncbi:MAG: class I SAM-dependent methyltransferase [Calditrichia bacterium]